MKITKKYLIKLIKEQIEHTKDKSKESINIFKKITGDEPDVLSKNCWHIATILFMEYKKINPNIQIVIGDGHSGIFIPKYPNSDLGITIDGTGIKDDLGIFPTISSNPIFYKNINLFIKALNRRAKYAFNDKTKEQFNKILSHYNLKKLE